MKVRGRSLAIVIVIKKKGSDVVGIVSCRPSYSIHLAARHIHFIRGVERFCRACGEWRLPSPPQPPRRLSRVGTGDQPANRPRLRPTGAQTTKTRPARAARGREGGLIAGPFNFVITVYSILLPVTNKPTQRSCNPGLPPSRRGGDDREQCKPTAYSASLHTITHFYNWKWRAVRPLHRLISKDAPLPIRHELPFPLFSASLVRYRALTDDLQQRYSKPSQHPDANGGLRPDSPSLIHSV